MTHAIKLRCAEINRQPAVYTTKVVCSGSMSRGALEKSALFIGFLTGSAPSSSLQMIVTAR